MRLNSRRRCAVTMVEAIVCAMVVGTMVVAALNALGASRMGQARLQTRAQGLLLAQRLMSEILSLQYEEPTLPPGTFGPSAVELAAGNRSLFDDVDDYSNFIESPPRAQDGSSLSGLDDWGWRVAVSWVNPLDPRVDSSTDTRVKRITVRTTCNGRDVARLDAVVTGAGSKSLSNTALVGLDVGGEINVNVDTTGLGVNVLGLNLFGLGD